MSESLSLDNIPDYTLTNGVGVGVCYHDTDIDTIVKIPSQCWTAKQTIFKQKTYVLEPHADIIVFAKKRELFNIVRRNGYDVLYIEYPDKSVELVGPTCVIQQMLLWLDSGVSSMVPLP